MTATHKVILGTMTFGTGPGGRIADKTIIQKILDYYKSKGHKEVDTARMYCAGNTEEVLGEMEVPKQFEIASKINPAVFGDHSPEKLRSQFDTILKALKADKVDLLYLHAPDYGTPFDVTAGVMNELYKEGKFKEWGLSNFSSWEVAQIVTICKERGWIAPTVYQGMYNPITRGVELELIPCLHEFGLRFYAYNPLAGGLLTGKFSFDQEDPVADGVATKGGRFDPSHVQGQRYRERFWRKPLFDAIEIVKQASEKEGISIVEASMRWMANHSKLNSEKFGDATLVGGSSFEQLAANIDYLSKGPLPATILDAFDKAWLVASPQSPPYFRDKELMLSMWAKK
ncbi:aflatoxin B1 aldehyde reductase member 2 [Gonapodya prolifera JEL478]|uniref:Aflatoxin B1 aldehyde reductase member 2 n=1 Tax=Gonapodya prolifera (strain JEL478) TaxID=1344416 RepID=A0A139AAZ7_GONPJ|nr:aflatoxin B1 aldehyde reductase member 2 [Gonapodya prolifera JEL478]|eukprot:KXS13563.1 aflatoxin B1 aldehyde reductase member 2 [Gonapodya prolifera JEL478]